MRLRRFLATGLVCVALLMPAAAQTPSLESAVKAAYLTKFIPFIQWPDTAFASPAAPVTICVLGDDPFGPSLDMACNLATAAAVKALTVKSPELSEMSEDDLERLTEEHLQVSTMVTKSVIGQMMSRGMIHIGAHA